MAVARLCRSWCWWRNDARDCSRRPCWTSLDAIPCAFCEFHAMTLFTLHSVCSGVFRVGGLAPGPPFQPTIIFYDGIFGCSTNFFLLKHQNLGIQWQKSVSFWGTKVSGGLRPPDPLGPLLSHILNTPLSVWKQRTRCAECRRSNYYLRPGTRTTNDYRQNIANEGHCNNLLSVLWRFTWRVERGLSLVEYLQGLPVCVYYLV